MKQTMQHPVRGVQRVSAPAMGCSALGHILRKHQAPQLSAFSAPASAAACPVPRRVQAAPMRSVRARTAMLDRPGPGDTDKTPAAVGLPPIHSGFADAIVMQCKQRKAQFPCTQLHHAPWCHVCAPGPLTFCATTSRLAARSLWMGQLHQGRLVQDADEQGTSVGE